MKTNATKTMAAVACAATLMWANAGRGQLAVEVFDDQPVPPGGISVPAPASDRPAAADLRGAQDVIEFANKDKLHGTLVSVAPGEYGLRWKSGYVEKPIDFALTGLVSATLSKRSSGKDATSGALAKLSNGDILPGNIVSLDKDKLVFETWYAGRININRAMIKTLNPNASISSTIYEGPTDLESWSTGRHGSVPAWRYKDGTLIAMQSYAIGRNIENFPDLADVQFDAAWRIVPSFYFTFFSDSVQEIHGNCYSVCVGGSSIYMYRYSRDGNSQNLGSGNISLFDNNVARKARFNVLINKKERSFTLLVNGKMVKQWMDPREFGGLGRGIVFQPQNQGDLRLSGIKISQWDGKIPQITEGEAELKEDLVRLINGDKVSGKLRSIAEGKLKFDTSYATLDIPLERVAELSASTQNLEKARRNKDDIRVSFVDRGVITLRLTRLEKEEIRGQSENFGSITLPLGAFRLLEFNIYQERKTDDDDSLL